MPDAFDTESSVLLIILNLRTWKWDRKKLEIAFVFRVSVKPRYASSHRYEKRSLHTRLALTMGSVNLTDNGKKKFEQLYCSAVLAEETQEWFVYISATNIFLSITAFTWNFLTLVALRKESSLHPPSKLLLRCLCISDLGIGLLAEPLHVAYVLALTNGRWDVCPYVLFSSTMVSYTLSGVTLLTMTAISVDRLLALLLGLQYKTVVTIKRTRVFVLAFWIVSGISATTFLVNYFLSLLYATVAISLCVLTSIFSYAKIFSTLRNHQRQICPQQVNQTCRRLDKARHRKRALAALWLQFALVLCYLPYGAVSFVGVKTSAQEKVSSSFFLARVITITLVHLNSSLNPVLYFWKMKSVRQAMKKTIENILRLFRNWLLLYFPIDLFILIFNSSSAA